MLQWIGVRGRSQAGWGESITIGTKVILVVLLPPLLWLLLYDQYQHGIINIAIPIPIPTHSPIPITTIITITIAMATSMAIAIAGATLDPAQDSWS